MLTWTQTPIEDLWNHIRFFCYEHNCKKLLKGEIFGSRKLLYRDSPELDKKAKQMAMCIKQANDYFNASNSVSINTSPLLLYYGMLSLAKALIIANKQDIFIEHIKYHGLETRPRTEALRVYNEDPTLWTMEQEFAVTNAGVFQYLAELYMDNGFLEGSVIKFKDLLSICPEISDIYERYYHEPSKTLYYYDYKKKTDVIEQTEKYMISFVCDAEDVYTRFPRFRTDFNLETEKMHGIAAEFNSINFHEVPDYFSEFKPCVGGQYIVSGIEYTYNNKIETKIIHQALLDYLAVYILSICVRYKQDFWGEIIGGEKSGVLGLIELYINVVKRRYPNYILNLLVGEEFAYGSPARLM